MNIEHTVKEHYLFWQYDHSGYRGVWNIKYGEFLIFLYSGVILYLYNAVCNGEWEVVFKHKTEMWSLFSFQEYDAGHDSPFLGFSDDEVGYID